MVDALRIEEFADRFRFWASQTLEKLAAKKKKTNKKLDPKAKVRNRGTVCVPASSAKDKKDHFPINNADQARNALARVMQYDKAPPWYKSSLRGLQALVRRKVHAKYPGIGKDKKKKKSSSEVNPLLHKYSQAYQVGQVLAQTPPGVTTQSKSGFKQGDIGTDARGNTFQASMQNGRLVWTVTALAKS